MGVSFPPWGGGGRDSLVRSRPCSHDSSGKRVGILEAALAGKLCSVRVYILHLLWLELNMKVQIAGKQHVFYSVIS